VTANGTPGRTPAWIVVAGQECRDLWLRGRGLPLLIAYSVLLSVTTYLTAGNEAINFLEQREAVSLTLQVAVAVGALLTLLAAADGISGERERGTLESLLLSPARRWELVLGKGLAAMSLWLVAFAISIPYVWFLGRGIGLVAVPLTSGLVVGSLLSLAFTGLGLTVSELAASNRASLAVNMLLLLALYAPTQFPVGAQSGWAGELFQRFNPLTAGLHYLGRLVIDAHGAADDLSWLLAPSIAAAAGGAVALLASRYLALGGASR
jgi:ABC-2 type transport system permease protein